MFLSMNDHEYQTATARVEALQREIDEKFDPKNRGSRNHFEIFLEVIEANNADLSYFERDLLLAKTFISFADRYGADNLEDLINDKTSDKHISSINALLFDKEPKNDDNFKEFYSHPNFLNFKEFLSCVVNTQKSLIKNSLELYDVFLRFQQDENLKDSKNNIAIASFIPSSVVADDEFMDDQIEQQTEKQISIFHLLNIQNTRQILNSSQINRDLDKKILKTSANPSKFGDFAYELFKHPYMICSLIGTNAEIDNNGAVSNSFLLQKDIYTKFEEYFSIYHKPNVKFFDFLHDYVEDLTTVDKSLKNGALESLQRFKEQFSSDTHMRGRFVRDFLRDTSAIKPELLFKTQFRPREEREKEAEKNNTAKPGYVLYTKNSKETFLVKEERKRRKHFQDTKSTSIIASSFVDVCDSMKKIVTSNDALKETKNAVVSGFKLFWESAKVASKAVAKTGVKVVVATVTNPRQSASNAIAAFDKTVTYSVTKASDFIKHMKGNHMKENVSVKQKIKDTSKRVVKKTSLGAAQALDSLLTSALDKTKKMTKTLQKP